DIPLPFKRMTYHDAMEPYGSDKPDTRFGMELINVSDVVANSSFKVFRHAVEAGGRVCLLYVKGQAAHFSRKAIDELTEFVTIYGAKGLAWIKIEDDETKGPIAKFLSDKEKNNLLERAEASEGDLLLFCADQTSIVQDSPGP